METLSPENRAMLELYKKERPDIFARLPLPRKLAEEFGVPISSETVHLMDFMKSHLAITAGGYDAVEEKVACTVTEAKDVSGGVLIVGSAEAKDDDTKTTQEAHREREEAIEANNQKWIAELQSEPILNVMEGGSNAAFVPK